MEDVLGRIQDVVEFADIPLKSVNQTGIFGNSPLAIVAGWGDVEGARLLLAAGADLDLRVEDGDTALHRAIAFGHAEIVKLLVECGASVTEPNDDGASPLDLAVSRGNDSIIELVRIARE